MMATGVSTLMTLLVMAGLLTACAPTHVSNVATPIPQPPMRLPYIEQSDPSRNPTEAEEATLEPYRACAREQAGIVLDAYDADPNRNNPKFILETLGATVEKVCREKLELTKKGPVELQTIPITAIYGESSVRSNEKRKKIEAEFQAEKEPIDDRYSDCLRTHTQMIALANNDTPDLVAIAVIASCRPIFQEINSLAKKYNMQSLWNPQLEEAIEARLKDGLILWVMQARASKPTPQSFQH